ncbi:MAG: exo-beta-N-acetylmuramidase NamZ domain-containing protein [Candidatus Babeliales bacterium]
MHARIIICISSMCILWISAGEFKLGVENIPVSLRTHLKEKRIGLITNQTGKDQRGRGTLEVLRSYGLSIHVLLAPEHGLTGRVQAEHDVATTIDQKSGLSVISLYSNGKGKDIQENTLGNLDVLIFDVQDSGMRHYTYISTLFEVLKAAARFHKELIVLDRPNPLGYVMEGPLVEPELQSFISSAPIPIRHGMTVGELASFFNVHLLKDPASLYVVPMRNYYRHQTTYMADTCMLSPNITTKAACYGYSFLGLIGEIRPFHTCIGTDNALQCIMLPTNTVSEARWQQLQNLLRTHHIESELYAYSNKQTQKSYKGLLLSIADINKVSSWTVFLTTVQFFKDAGVSLQFSPAFDKAVGTRSVQALVQGTITHHELHHYISKQLQQFYMQARPLFMYTPHPILSLVSQSGKGFR